MAVSWLFLAVSIVGALFTVAALRPPSRSVPVVALTFFPAWLTTELATVHLVWQGVATAVFVWLGALDHWPGWLGLAITAASWFGLVSLIGAARQTAPTWRRALDDALGEGWETSLEADETIALDTRIQWSRVMLPFRIAQKGVERTRNVDYVGDGIRRHRLDLYRRPDAGPKAPVLLQIHGGGWMVGSKDEQGLPLVYHMAARGWVCVATNYRLSPKATWPDHVVDCKRALAWIREHVAEYGGDPDFVVVTGGSAGGHLTAMMGLTANDPSFQPGFEGVDTTVQGIVPFYGVFDWIDRDGLRGRRDALRDLLERFVVKRRRDDAFGTYDAASPRSRVHRGAPPAMVVHGTMDSLAPVEEARRFVDDLRAVSRAPVGYVEFQGAHHAFDLFPSVRALHTVNGVETFLTWLARTGAARAAGAAAEGAGEPPSDPTTTARTAP